MSDLLTDELGQAFQITDEDKGCRIKGQQCILANIGVVRSIATFLSTSLGPTGMDKILQSKDEDIVVTNDGATILKEMEMTENPISRLIVQLSESQDEEIGDGTTSVVVLASALLDQAQALLGQGVHPIKISEGFEVGLGHAVEHLSEISEEISDLKETMMKAAKTSLGSKIVYKSLERFAEICTDAVLMVADMERKDLDFELINIESKVGRDLSSTALIKGIVINKEFSHPQMKKEVKDGRIALLSCPFEPPKLKTKHSLVISNPKEYKELEEYEKKKFAEMIESIKRSGSNIVMCQWGFDDEANSLLMENGLPAVRWVGGHELELLAVHTGGSIVARFEDLEESDLGKARVREESLGTENDKIIVVENEGCSKAVTILVRGANDLVIEEAKRSIRDALCAVRNILTNSRIVYGGGSSEMSCSLALERIATGYSGEEREAILGFGRALEEIPLCLARNSGHDPIGYSSDLRKLQMESKNFHLGVDCLGDGEQDMKKLGVFDALSSKIRQFQMATQLVTMVLKIDNVVSDFHD
ncbi:T COMPLEX PROTEIN 1 EPSILON SUBUNIT [Encephalitozoon cuniculi GB-M1]|uniref:T-complex protein 1 subunit epsilon n=2 Tax=Encephalitozoon cuniculi TaxID=6035 RepID=TCPE_ENCCU|nr:chaperonin-containing T-complex subunit CCT5 [Encephalitozoon cuniculi GB-M1]Q8SRP9.1 RecName: Full=T-complex protein 1 subunit epsilon; Short=TCP-1-epsilon; AltName: Full=CCT-epsilon [Encephalitozoon cuniculi GB-M1]AGE95673.1 t-complex protein 1 epsilon subunit [Encephalitozoon cuniculi]KMV65993.1 t-complex protein 1 subunit epsilon [Encephalitozoon cuniculi EcunIII-L]UYI27691.1 T-complex protein 1 subunit epsilon [Encephalitozoon cuniculi]CAD25459.1 T COMPLEX PROTEIN 1 EPSILON SUBUNIT [En